MGNRPYLKRQDGTVTPEVHVEDVVYVPPDAADVEREVVLGDGEEVEAPARRSLGQMLEEAGRGQGAAGAPGLRHPARPLGPG